VASVGYPVRPPARRPPPSWASGGVGARVATEAQEPGEAGSLINGGQRRFGGEGLDFVLDGRVGQVFSHR
jgi:hypothetical protein